MSDPMFDYDPGIHRSNEGDKNLLVRFYSTAIENQQRSVEEGRPIFDDTDMIEIRVRGDRNNVIQRPVRPEDKRRFRDAWLDYQDGGARTGSGTPLTEVPFITKALAEELKHLGFFTIEHVSQMNDDVCSRNPGFFSLKQKAVLYLQMASTGTAPITQLQAQIDQERSARQALEAQNRDLNARLEALIAAQSAGKAAEAKPEPAKGK